MITQTVVATEVEAKDVVNKTVTAHKRTRFFNEKEIGMFKVKSANKTLTDAKSNQTV